MWFYSFIFGLFCHIDYILLVHLIIKNDLKKKGGGAGNSWDNETAPLNGRYKIFFFKIALTLTSEASNNTI
jgi:hypothetical protein